MPQSHQQIPSVIQQSSTRPAAFHLQLVRLGKAVVLAEQVEVGAFAAPSA